MWRKGRWPAVLQQRNKEHVLLSAFVGLESAHFFSAFLPSYFTIRKFAHGDTEAMNSLYAGMVFALLFSVALGLVVSALLEALLPPASSPADPATDTGPCAGKGIIGGPLCQLGQIASNLTGIIAIALIAILLIVGLALIVQ